MIKGSNANKIRFNLSKQAAYAGMLNLVDDSYALGEIEVQIKTDDTNKFINWMIPEIKK